MGNKPNKKEIKKLIDLPIETVKIIDALAKKKRTKAKPYIENLVINHANDNKLY